MYMHPVIANSIPKAGTHLLRKCLYLFPELFDAGVHLDISLQTDTMDKLLRKMPGGGIATAHLLYLKEYAEILKRHECKTILIIRDPRDIVISFAHHVMKIDHHYLYGYYHDLLDDDARVMASIVGIREKIVVWEDVALRDIGDLCNAFLKWKDEEITCLVQFEHLVGPLGGGDRECQAREIMRIADHLEVDLSQNDVTRICTEVFDIASPTFRKGVIGDWRNQFTATHKQAFKEVAGQLLIDLGYESDFDW
jgi:Sulfotransferase domain